ncbi:Variable outer membrane protein [Borrelia duttonii CR2A]|uniref:Variable outer membrane protein n=1 Tax=Borrelia duttonii CR2A TaxID=1432657 RepID=W6TVX9_9SPIR|nr:Variable outer membrane protein [Borrelia duttonii CR2A]
MLGVLLKENEGNADFTKIQDERKDIGKLFRNQHGDSAEEAEAAKVGATIRAVKWG